MCRIETHTAIIPYTGKERTIRVCLPDAYDRQQEMHFPVLYMHDGQNLFGERNALGGPAWGMAEICDSLEKEKGFSILIVGLDNAGLKRGDEYLPWINDSGTGCFPVGKLGGKGSLYAEYFVKNLKGYVDETYRTISDFEHTSICGSSMGGYITAYIVAKYPDVYSKAGIFSLASWLAEKPLLDFIKENISGSKMRYFVQVGTEESSDMENSLMPQMYIDSSLNYTCRLLECGVRPMNVHLGIGAGDAHNEAAWKKYMESFILF